MRLKEKTRTKLKEAGFIVSMLILPVTGFLVFWLGVNFNSILLAFQKPIYGKPSVWSLENFSMLFKEFVDKDSVILQALKNTLIFFSVSLFVMIPLSLLMSFFLYKKIRFYRFFRYVFFLPSVISATVLTAVFSRIVGPNGVVSAVYEWLFHKDMPLLLATNRYALKTIVAYCIWTGFGVNVVLFSSAMMRVPSEVIEAGKLDGVSTFREFVSIIVPLIWPTISTVVTLAVVNVFSSSGPILLFTKGDHGTYTIAYWIFEQVYENNTYEYSAAVGLFFTIVGVPIVFIVRKVSEKLGEAIEY